MYWFVHLGTITELNGWDAMNPGHLDQHLFPFYQAELSDGTLDRDKAKELLSCLWIKINNHPAPPKVGVTAKENGPTAVVKSLGKLDQIKSGGTLLNQRLLPSVLEKEEDITNLMHLIRSYFKLNGHHIQFNVADTAMLRKAQAAPDEYRNLLVRVAGYSDHFVDLDRDRQEEIIARTENCYFMVCANFTTVIYEA